MFKKEKLKAYLDEKGMSYEKFGELVGVTGVAIMKIVRGFKQPSVALLRRIAEQMGCTMDDLCDGFTE